MLLPPYDKDTQYFDSASVADSHFLKLTEEVRKLSDDPKARIFPQSAVGAVIVKDNVVISRSANVFPPLSKSFRDSLSLEISDADRYHFIEHAERAAIFKALLQLSTIQGATIYCSRFPCSDCARAIVWAGIERCVLGAGIEEASRWIEAQRAALLILEMGGVDVQIIASDG